MSNAEDVDSQTREPTKRASAGDRTSVPVEQEGLVQRLASANKHESHWLLHQAHTATHLVHACSASGSCVPTATRLSAHPGPHSERRLRARREVAKQDMLHLWPRNMQ